MPAKRGKVGNPFRGVVDIISEMNRMSERMTSGDSSAAAPPRGHSDAWNPTTDILAMGSDLLVRCEVPGVRAEDVEVALSHGTLTIVGERHHGDETNDDFYVQERHYGRFRRDITLPEGVREADIGAELREGVLQIVVSGAANAAGPAQIAVRHVPSD
ncbi:Hsp20/alpha crystallin family protein [Pseudonocardia sp.]|uniref:Hsp20/alpha crystallin family protein n=1 Tax=Pseudonocardia sp. TaxID=60912 RepID=UPI00262C2A11|nr:Hsp20/alpha crystallin family protein [Pseudonocardia sp.]